jgi:hypothetical protein
VTSHLICDNLEAIAFVYFIDVMHNLVHLNEISSFSLPAVVYVEQYQMLWQNLKES